MWYIVVITSAISRLEAVIPVYAISPERAKEKALNSLSYNDNPFLEIEVTFECGNTKPLVL